MLALLLAAGRDSPREKKWEPLSCFGYLPRKSWIFKHILSVIYRKFKPSLLGVVFFAMVLVPPPDPRAEARGAFFPISNSTRIIIIGVNASWKDRYIGLMPRRHHVKFYNTWVYWAGWLTMFTKKIAKQRNIDESNSTRQAPPDFFAGECRKLRRATSAQVAARHSQNQLVQRST